MLAQTHVNPETAPECDLPGAEIGGREIGGSPSDALKLSLSELSHEAETFHPEPRPGIQQFESRLFGLCLHVDEAGHRLALAAWSNRTADWLDDKHIEYKRTIYNALSTVVSETLSMTSRAAALADAELPGASEWIQKTSEEMASILAVCSKQGTLPTLQRPVRLLGPKELVGIDAGTPVHELTNALYRLFLLSALHKPGEDCGNLREALAEVEAKANALAGGLPSILEAAQLSRSSPVWITPFSRKSF